MLGILGVHCFLFSAKKAAKCVFLSYSFLIECEFLSFCAVTCGMYDLLNREHLKELIWACQSSL